METNNFFEKTEKDISISAQSLFDEGLKLNPKVFQNLNDTYSREYMIEILTVKQNSEQLLSYSDSDKTKENERTGRAEILIFGGFIPLVLPTTAAGSVSTYSACGISPQQTRSGLKKSGATRTILGVRGHFHDKRFSHFHARENVRKIAYDTSYAQLAKLFSAKPLFDLLQKYILSYHGPNRK